MKTVLLATFQELEPAQQLRLRLEQGGIPSIITNDSKLQRLWFISEPRAPIHLEVPRPDFQAAAHLVKEWPGALDHAIHCPACQSARVEFPQLTRKFVTPSFGSLLMAIGLLQREFYCLDCQYTWPEAVHAETLRDTLGWPSQSKLWHSEGPRSHP